MIFTAVDLGLIALFVISMLVGIYRGLVKEILSLISWVAAAWVAFVYGPAAAEFVRPYVSQPPLDLAIAYVLVFVAALIVLSIISFLIGKLFSATGLSGIDRTLGMIFGLLRAALVVGAVILVGRFMAFEEHSWWTDAHLLDYFEPVTEWIKTYLPAKISDQL